jgi:hypothetical protein
VIILDEVVKDVSKPSVINQSNGLSVLGFGLAFGVVGAIGMLIMTVAGMFGAFSAWIALFVDAYGFLGFSSSWLGVVLGTVYGFIDCFVFGALVAWFYNMFKK